VTSENKLSIFNIDQYLTDISQVIKDVLVDHFLEYGISLESFFITGIMKPEDDPAYQRFKQIHFRQYADAAEARIRQQVAVIDQQTEAQKTVIEAEALARKRSMEGYTYQEERRFDVAEKVAANEAVGEFTNMGVGMGMIAGISTPVSGAVGGMMTNALHNTIDQKGREARCIRCNTLIPGNAKFCLNCGEKVGTNIISDNSVACPVCGKIVSPGKFCLECGSPLEVKCSNCGLVIPNGAKFCPDCGQKA
jgi:membrane protease subunit (stomatin/prohibitin family)